MSLFAEWIYRVHDWVWGMPLLILILGTGLYLTYLFRGLQIRKLPLALKMAYFEKEKEGYEGDISPFQALMTTLAAAIGTGNIAGVATALTIGGMGALFWMWVTAILGMATKFAEAVLSVKYRIVDHRGEMAGGPMYTLERGLGFKWLGVAFAAIGMVAATGAGNMIQSNSVADAFNLVFEVNPWLVGVILALATGVVLIGGVKSIGKVASYLVPSMALFYLAGGCFVLATHLHLLPEVLKDIIQSAFSGSAAVGGFAGAAVVTSIQAGVSRGVFASEAGLGTTAIADAAAKIDRPVHQALISMTGTFLSVIVICTITGLVIGVTKFLGATNSLGEPLTGASLAILAFDSVIWKGKFFVIIGLILFAYSTILAWSYYGERCCEYLFGEAAIPYYRVVYCLILIPGAALDLKLAWTIANIMNGLLAIPNLIGVLGLSHDVKDEVKKYFSHKA